MRWPDVNTLPLNVVTALGLTTATSYALSGYLDCSLTTLLIAGGNGGAALGISLGRKLAAHKRLFERAFAPWSSLSASM